jgi:hypothetical protein
VNGSVVVVELVSVVNTVDAGGTVVFLRVLVVVLVKEGLGVVRVVEVVLGVDGDDGGGLKQEVSPLC